MIIVQGKVVAEENSNQMNKGMNVRMKQNECDLQKVRTRKWNG